MTPEHLHLALNHLSFVGAGFALIPLVLGLVLRHRVTVIAGLLLAAMAGWTTPFVMGSGEAAYARYQAGGAVASYLDAEAQAYLEAHEARAHAWSKVLYASALITTLCLGVLWWKPATVKATALVAILACLASLAVGIWIAASGGPIRRPDFRSEAASPAEHMAEPGP